MTHKAGQQLQGWAKREVTGVAHCRDGDETGSPPILYVLHLQETPLPWTVTREGTGSSVVFCMETSIATHVFWFLLLCSYWSIHSECLPRFDSSQVCLPRDRYTRKRMHRPLTRLCPPICSYNLHCSFLKGTRQCSHFRPHKTQMLPRPLPLFKSYLSPKALVRPRFSHRNTCTLKNLVTKEGNDQIGTTKNTKLLFHSFSLLWIYILWKYFSNTGEN